MAHKSVNVKVNPSVMKWARESAGIDDLEYIKKRLNVSTSTIEEWEEGTKKPTLSTLEKLARYYKRPLAVFFLPEPPQEPPMPADFRVLPEEQRRPLSTKTRLAIRRSRRVQSLATELLEMESANGKAVANIGSASLNDDPEITAARERKRIGITVDEQSRFISLHKAFDKWREALENLNIVVYQTRMPLKEARGFSLLDNMLPAIVVNISDVIAARIFTLFHEYAHLTLGISGICTPFESFYDDADIQRIEKFCNHFAGAFLVPRQSLEKDEWTRLINSQSYLDDYCLNELARRFRVSKQVILRRLLICGLISRNQYMNKLEDLLSQLTEFLYKEKPEEESKKEGFGIPSSKRCIWENGKFFTSLVMEARERELITHSDLADYLAINLKHVEKVEALLRK